MKLPFVDRERELARIRGRLQGRGPSLIALYGRRRCGKSRLLQEALADRPCAYYVGDDRQAPLQRADLAREMARVVSGLDQVTYPGWEALLERWWREAPAGAALALDELPALVAQSPELPSLLQKQVDRGSRPLHTLLAGSSQRMMLGLLLEAAAPLYGRAEEVLRIEPLEVRWVRDAFRLSGERAVETWALWGGVPRYWELALDHRGRWQALRQLVLDPLGVLHREPERLLLDDFRETAQAASLLAIIGRGCHRISEIGARLGQPATSLTRPLARLLDLGLVARELPWGRSARDSKRTLYRIADPFLRFWYRFVEPNRSRLGAGHVAAVEAEIRREWPAHVGSVWEDLARWSTARLTLAGRKWEPGARWWGPGLDGKPLELDIVAAASRDPDVALVGEARRACRAREVAPLHEELARKAANCPGLAGKRIVTALWCLKPVQGPRVITAADLVP